MFLFESGQVSHNIQPQIKIKGLIRSYVKKSHYMNGPCNM